jgi:hypothetical protein
MLVACRQGTRRFIISLGQNLPADLNRERREESIFRDLLRLCHGLEERLVNASIEEVGMMADMVKISLLSPLLALRPL